MSQKHKLLTDPVYNQQYRTIHNGRPYGRSGLQFLPETVLYFIACVADNRIDLGKRPRILDYGCGHSLMLDAMCYVLAKHMPTLKTLQAKRAGLAAMFLPLIPDIQHFLKQDTIIEPYQGNLVSPRKFDPSIPELSRFPYGKFDFVTCTDVLEHIPEYSRLNNTHPLSNTIKTIANVSPNVFYNISTRLAAQMLPNGQNAHCTLLTPQQWHAKLQKNSAANHTISPVLSRDFTSCAFYYGHISSGLNQLQYKLLEEFGPIDLIACPPAPNMAPEKIARLQGLQPHKNTIQSQYISYWLQTDPNALNNKHFRAACVSAMSLNGKIKQKKSVPAQYLLT